MAAIRIDSATKEYDNGYVAVRNVDLDIADGELLVLVGPSGCGKSTLLRMVAGLEDVTSGEIYIAGRLVNHEAPKDRNIAMVFQNYALYPHMTVRKNISYALRLARVPRDEIRRRVDEAARVLELEDFLDAKPGRLSGGQRQRVAMGRAIVRQPDAYLMDEPLSNLDAKLRVQMRAEIARLQHDLGVTTIYVTHDQVEAMTMGTRVAVLKDGTIQQVASPQTLYDRPVNVFVAAFIGSPSMNLYRARLERGTADNPDGLLGLTVALGRRHLTLPPDVVDATPGLTAYAGKDIVVGIRPEALSEVPAGTPASPAGTDPAAPDPAAPDPDGTPAQTLEAVVELVESLGADLLVHTSITATPAAVDDPDLLEAAPLPSAGAGDRADVARCLARFGPRSAVKVADNIRLAVDVSQLHFFDPETGLRVESAA